MDRKKKRAIQPSALAVAQARPAPAVVAHPPVTPKATARKHPAAKSTILKNHQMTVRAKAVVLVLEELSLRHNKSVTYNPSTTIE